MEKYVPKLPHRYPITIFRFYGTILGHMKVQIQNSAIFWRLFWLRYTVEGCEVFYQYSNFYKKPMKPKYFYEMFLSQNYPSSSYLSKSV